MMPYNAAYVYVHLCLRKSVSVCGKQSAGSIDSQGLWDLLPSPFSWAVTFLAVTLSKESWQLSRCVSCVCMSGCVLISSCFPPSLQVSVCWCLTGGLRKTLPGKCIWASARRTAGEGLSLRWCSLLLKLLSFNLWVLHDPSLIHLPATLSFS